MATSFSSMLDPWIGGANEQLFASTGSIMSSNDLWTVNECQFDMPTPPVSPSHNDMVEVKREPITTTTTPQTPPSTTAPIEEDLDLGLGELISGLDLPSGLFLDDPDSWFNDVFQTTDSSSSVVPDVLDTKCEVNELRHDCMWAGHCPAEEHRSKKDLVQLPCLLSSSPPESTVLSMATLPLVLQPTAGGNRTRLDTFGSTRPETPLSLSDSELDADQLTSDEGNNKGNSSSSSSSADESESDEDRMMHHYQPTLPPNIHPVRSHQIRKLQIQNKSLVKMVMSSSSSLIPDHSYSHSDHSYHTQRRPINNDLMANPFDLGAPTPSDSEEEIDVVSLGEVLRMNPSGTMTTSLNSSSSSKSLASSVSTLGSANNSHAPLRLKLKVAPASAVSSSSTSSSSAAAAIVNSSSASGQVLMRKALPSHPSALVRQQLQLAVASAAQQRKHSESTKKSSGDMKMSGKNGSSSSKRPRSSGESGSSSPRKRCSRAPSDSEDSCEKRSQHNSMERQRRVDLRNAFEFLRSLIPDLEATDRAAKVVILKKAANFCQGLTQREKQFVADKDALQKRQEMLRKRLAMLQRRR